MEKIEFDQLMKDAYTMGSAFAYDGHDLQYSMNKFNLDKYNGLSAEMKDEILNQFKSGFEHVKSEEIANSMYSSDEVTRGKAA